MNEKSKAAICTDEIEAAVYAQLKPLGFRKYGGHCTALSPATCRRSSTSSAVCRLRAPHSKCGSISASAYRECDERTFSPSPPKRYYRRIQLTLRSRLGSIDGQGGAVL